MSAEVNTKWYICRICLKSEHKKLYNIFDDIAEDEIGDLGMLQEKIELFGDIKLNQQNNLPTKICNRCVLLLRAACKFRDLCQQSQNQLKQFVNIQKQEIEEQNDITFDSDAEEQQTEVQEECENEMLTSQTIDDGYMIEERVDFEEALDDAIPEIANNDHEFEPPLETDDLKVISEEDDDHQYIVEEVNAKQFISVNDEEENTTYKYEADLYTDNIIIEEQTHNPDRRKIYIKKNLGETKATTKRKPKFSDDINEFKVLYECTHCENTYTDKAKFKMHIKIHNKEKPHECEICKKGFSTTPQLSRHMNSHTGNRPYKCKYCDARFGDPSTKIKHQRIHTNERPYKCDLCDKAFAYSNVLKVHMMTHTGEKPHSCDYCGQTFAQVHHKNNHEKKHSNIVLQGSRNIDYMDADEELNNYNKVEEIIQ